MGVAGGWGSRKGSRKAGSILYTKGCIVTQRHCERDVGIVTQKALGNCTQVDISRDMQGGRVGV